MNILNIKKQPGDGFRFSESITEKVQVESWSEGYGNYTVNGISVVGSLSQNAIQEKKLIKITDVLARSVDENTKGSLLYIYDDGSVEKKYLVK